MLACGGSGETLPRVAVGTKARLRPWLEAMINEGQIPGLRWVNEERTMFRIPWKHHGKQDWSPENSQIFMVGGCPFIMYPLGGGLVCWHKLHVFILKLRDGLIFYSFFL